MKKLITIFLILLTATLFSQTTVYVDPTAGSGGDGSIESPFDSWEDVSFSNGNTYLQKRGTTYHMPTYINIDGITNVHVGAYGTGTEYAYIVDDRNTGDANYACINTGNSEGLLIDSLSFYGTNYPSYMSIAAISMGKSEWSANTNNDITIRDCKIRRFNWGIRGLTYLWGTEADTELDKFGNLHISRTEIDSTYDDGIFLQRLGTPITTDTAFIIDYCHISRVNQQYDYAGTWAGDCIQYSGTFNGVYIVKNNALIRYNYEKFNVIFNSKGTGTTGLLRGDGGKVIIEKNYIDAPATNASALYLTVHYLWPQNDSVQFIVRNNTFISDDGVNGIYFATDDATKVHNTYVYGNTFEGFGTCTNSGAPTGNVSFYNNIFDGYTTQAIRHPSVDVRNNMFIGDGGGTAIVTSGEWTLNQDANWYTNGLDLSISVKDSTGNIVFNDTSVYYNSVWLQDCGLTSATTVRNYGVQSTSHTIDAGVIIPMITYDNDSIIYSGAYDIGAYEYVLDVPTSNPNSKIYIYDGKLIIYTK